jgi:tetratricopeptide (TPR) repeat protein
VAILTGGLVRERFGGTSPNYVLSRTFLVFSLAELGNFADATTRANEALAVAETVATTHALMHAHLGLGALHLRQGDFGRAIASFRRCVELARTRDVPFYVPWSASYLRHSYSLAGRLSEGIPLLEEAVARGAAMGVFVNRSLWLTHLGEAYLSCNRLDDAAVISAKAIEFAQSAGERGHEGWVLRLLGEIALRRNPAKLDDADAHYRQALARAEELGIRPLVAHCHAGLAKLYRRAGKREQVLEHCTTARRLYRDMDMRFWQEMLEAEIG